jgi:hypothetical protein
VNVWDYLAFLENCVDRCGGHVDRQNSTVFEGDFLAEFEAIVSFPGGFKLCIHVEVERDDDGHAFAALYGFHLQDGRSDLVERWDYEPEKNPPYHRHKPGGRDRIPDTPKDLPEIITIVWNEYVMPESPH